MPISRPSSWLSTLALVAVTAVTAHAQTLDSPFNAGIAGTVVNAIAVQADGKIIVGGSFYQAGWNCGPTTCPVTRNNIARFNADGSLDAGFNPGANGEVFALAVQPDGKILVGGSFSTIGGGGTGSTARRQLARLNADGSVDTGFDPVPAGAAFSTVRVILLQSNGEIILGPVAALKTSGGTLSLPGRIGRLLTDGTADPTYTPGIGNDLGINTMVLDGQGRLLVGGSFRLAGSGGTIATTRERIARFLVNGTLDPDFNPGVSNPGGTSSAVEAIAVQPDGRILVGGPFRLIGGGTGTESRNFIARLTDTGAVEAFDAGINTGDGFNTVRSIALQADGRILLGGFFSTIGGLPRVSFGRLTSDGAVDTDFASMSAVVNNTITAVTLQEDGKILVGGFFATNNSAQRNKIARLNNTAAATQALTVTGGGSGLSWTRSGTSPEFSRVTFEVNDGTAWTPLGAGTRVAGGWQLTGLGLPGNPIVRARGFAPGSLGNGSGSVLQTLLIPAGVNVVQNNSFTSGTTGWLQFGLPDINAMVSSVVGGVFNFYRSGTQAVVFKETGLPLPANAPIQTQFQIGNTDSVRKRISVLVHDSNFSDLFVCTFWLPPNAPLATYGLNTHTTQAWSNATISFYAATNGSSGGSYQLDNVSVQYVPAGSANTTRCIDPTTPAPPGGATSAELLVNGNFASAINTGTGWATFGQISGAVTSGVFQFIKLAGAPAGVILQPTALALPANELITATVQLGNSSSVRKRVTVILHDNDFSDLSACTFWIPAGQPLSTYVYQTFTTKAWTNATLSVYPATVGAEQWIRLDNATFRRTPTAVMGGTECLEPGSAADSRSDGWTSSGAGLMASPASTPLVDGGTTTPDVRGEAPAGEDAVDTDAGAFELSGWIADGFAWTGSGWVAHADTPGLRTLTLATPVDITDRVDARLTGRSWLSSLTSRAAVQVSVDGTHWETALVVAPSDTWMPVDIDLRAWAGLRVYVRLVFESSEPLEDVWRVEEVTVEVDR